MPDEQGPGRSGSGPRVIVVRSRFGGVLGEIAVWLADAMKAELRAADSPETADGDLVVLVGAGIEFDTVLLRASRTRQRPRMVLWAFDPFPPPGLGADVTERGMRAGRRANRLRRLDAALGHPLGGAAATGRSKRTLRKLAVRAARGSSTLLPATADHGDPVISVMAFERLAWLKRTVSAGEIDAVVVSSPASARTLAEHGIAAHYQPIARHAGMGRHAGRTRDLPVVFLGASGDERGARLRALASALDCRGIPLTIVDRNCFGDDRTALLNRARIVVNLHKFPWHFERIRLFLAVANGALFVSEHPVADPEPFEVGRHLIASAEADLAAAIAGALADEQGCARMTAAAFEQFSRQPDMRDVGRRLVELA